MNYKLLNTPNGYNISCNDLLTSLMTGVSGLPYAKRHWNLSNQCEPQYRLGHRVIAVLEAIPLLGALAALIERIAVFVSTQLMETPAKSKNTEPKINVLPKFQLKIENPLGIEKNVKIESINPPKVNPLLSTEIQSHQISPEVDKEAFKQYLFSDPQQLPQNAFLLENTLCLADCLTNTMNYHQITSSDKNMEEVMNRVFESTNRQTYFSPYWFKYNNHHHFYIDFAHATTFGGAYRSYGCVQEERMFAEFPALALLDFKTKNGIHPCIESYDAQGYRLYPPAAKPSPFIIESIHQQFDISATPYGGAFQRADQATILNGIKKVDNPLPVNIIGLAAVDWRNVKNPEYKIEDLRYHLEAAYLANCGAKKISAERGWTETVIHTAPWGCGAFLNSEKMITAIQYLAAEMAGTDLAFHGIGNAMNPDYTKENIDEIIDWISQLIRNKNTPQQILNILLEKSLTHSSWSPKQI